jgi:hypothetical protein
VLCPALYWVCGGNESSFAGLVGLYQLAPFSLVSLAFAVTRRQSAAAPALETAAAGLWCATYLFVALLQPFCTNLERFGTRAIDAMACIVECAAVTQLGLAIVALLTVRPAGRSRGAAWCHGLGTALVALYLVRDGAGLYVSTRLAGSGGLAAISYEVHLLLWVFAIAAAALFAGAMMPGGSWRSAAQ